MKNPKVSAALPTVSSTEYKNPNSVSTALTEFDAAFSSTTLGEKLKELDFKIRFTELQIERQRAIIDRAKTVELPKGVKKGKLTSSLQSGLKYFEGNLSAMKAHRTMLAPLEAQGVAFVASQTFLERMVGQPATAAQLKELEQSTADFKRRLEQALAANKKKPGTHSKQHIRFLETSLKVLEYQAKYQRSRRASATQLPPPKTGATLFVPAKRLTGPIVPYPLLAAQTQRSAIDRQTELEMAKLDVEEAEIKHNAAREEWELKAVLRDSGTIQESEFRLAASKYFLSRIAVKRAELIVKRLEEQAKKRNAAPAAPYWGLPGQPTTSSSGQPKSPQRVLPLIGKPVLVAAPVVPYPVGTVGLPEKSKSSKKRTLLYDGKTFDQWNQEWRTELNPNKRANAIKAFRQFAKAGYAKEAAKAILEVMQNYDSLIRDRLAEANLSGTAAIGYAAIVDQEVPMRLLVDELESERRNGQRFALVVLSVPRSNELTRTKTYEEALSAIARLIENQKVDRRTRIFALQAAAKLDRSQKTIQAALLKAMKDKDHRVASQAIELLVPDSNTWSSTFDSKEQGQQGKYWREYITELPDEVVDEVVALMKSEEAETRIRIAAWQAFDYLEMHPRFAYHVLQTVEKLKRGNLKRHEREAAYQILSRAKPEVMDQIVPLLIEQYKQLAGYVPSEDNANEKARILNTLYAFGPKSRAALPLIKEAKKSKYGTLQWSAQKALKSIGPEETSIHAE